VQPAGDLFVTRPPAEQQVFIGIRHGGRVRLSLMEGRQLAGVLLELCDPDYRYVPPDDRG
jgi:hypothetical protein